MLDDFEFVCESRKHFRAQRLLQHRHPRTNRSSANEHVSGVAGHVHDLHFGANLVHALRGFASTDSRHHHIGQYQVDARALGLKVTRVVIDPGARLPAAAKMFTRDGVRRLVMTAHDVKPQLPADIEIVGLQTFQRRIAPEAILSALHERGLRRILIEGGAETVSRFLVANCLDRLHVVVAPIIIGSGRPSFTLPPIDRVQEALRAPMKIHQLDGDVLFDCDLSAQRPAIGQGGH